MTDEIRLARIENKLDAIKTVVIATSTNQKNLVSCIKNLGKESKKNTKFRNQTKAILSFFGILFGFFSYVNLKQCESETKLTSKVTEITEP